MQTESAIVRSRKALLRLSDFMLRLASLFVIALVSFSKGHVILSHPPLFHDLSVLNADNPICKAGNIIVVRNHNDSLLELRAGALDKAQ